VEACSTLVTPWGYWTLPLIPGWTEGAGAAPGGLGPAGPPGVRAYRVVRLTWVGSFSCHVLGGSFEHGLGGLLTTGLMVSWGSQPDHPVMVAHSHRGRAAPGTLCRTLLQLPTP